jgi:hypothetical protein
MITATIGTITATAIVPPWLRPPLPPALLVPLPCRADDAPAAEDDDVDVVPAEVVSAGAVDVSTIVVVDVPGIVEAEGIVVGVDEVVLGGSVELLVVEVVLVLLVVGIMEVVELLVDVVDVVGIMVVEVVEVVDVVEEEEDSVLETGVVLVLATEEVVDAGVEVVVAEGDGVFVGVAAVLEFVLVVLDIANCLNARFIGCLKLSSTMQRRYCWRREASIVSRWRKERRTCPARPSRNR